MSNLITPSKESPTIFHSTEFSMISHSTMSHSPKSNSSMYLFYISLNNVSSTISSKKCLIQSSLNNVSFSNVMSTNILNSTKHHSTLSFNNVPLQTSLIQQMSQTIPTNLTPPTIKLATCIFLRQLSSASKPVSKVLSFKIHNLMK